MSWRRRGAAMGCVVFALACEPVRPPDIVLIVADTLRADRLGCYGYRKPTSPVIDRFAEENLRFRWAISPAPWTSPSIASLFTGLYPTAHGVVRDALGEAVPTDALDPSLTTLAERLSESGYQTLALESNGWTTAKRGYAQGFDTFERADGLDARVISQRARVLLDSSRDPNRPLFLFVQYMDPHTPNFPPKEQLDRFHPAGAARKPPQSDLGVLVDLNARYDAEIRTLDDGVGELFDHLRELGLYEGAVIAFVSDHGEQLYEHGEYGHGLRLHDEEIRVPLILKAPGQHGVVEEVVSTLDLAPTLLELAGAAPLRDVQGLSLLTQREERVARGAFSEGTRGRNHKAIVAAGGEKLILEFAGDSAQPISADRGVSEVGLYDLQRGEKERDRLVDPARRAGLERLLRQEYARSRALRARVEPVRVQLDAAERDALEALGYGN